LAGGARRGDRKLASAVTGDRHAGDGQRSVAAVRDCNTLRGAGRADRLAAEGEGTGRADAGVRMDAGVAAGLVGPAGSPGRVDGAHAIGVMGIALQTGVGEGRGVRRHAADPAPIAAAPLDLQLEVELVAAVVRPGELQLAGRGHFYR